MPARTPPSPLEPWSSSSPNPCRPPDTDLAGWERGGRLALICPSSLSTPSRLIFQAG